MGRLCDHTTTLRIAPQSGYQMKKRYAIGFPKSLHSCSSQHAALSHAKLATDCVSRAGPVPHLCLVERTMWRRGCASQYSIYIPSLFPTNLGCKCGGKMT